MNDPRKPDISECCGSGCTPCIFDIYEQQLNKTTQIRVQTGKNCISPTTYTIFKIINIQQDSCDTFLCTFKYLRKNKINNEDETDEHNILLFEPGQHFLLRGQDTQDKYFTRAYTPITNEADCFTILVKFYTNGLMSKYLRDLSFEAETYWRGPYGDHKINHELNHLLVICQGTGIAPFYPIIRRMVENDQCETFIKLFYCCKNGDNIHLRNRVYDLSSYWNFTYEVYLSRAHSQDIENKKYKESINCRRFDMNDLSEYLRGRTLGNFQLLICGNDSFNKIILGWALQLNVNRDFIYVF